MWDLRGTARGPPAEWGYEPNRAPPIDLIGLVMKYVLLVPILWRQMIPPNRYETKEKNQVKTGEIQMFAFHI